MAKHLGWSLERLYSRKGEAGRRLASRIESDYRARYGKADAYTNPRTLKERRREKHEKNVLKKQKLVETHT
jgi:hypothetical protein